MTTAASTRTTRPKRSAIRATCGSCRLRGIFIECHCKIARQSDSSAIAQKAERNPSSRRATYDLSPKFPPSSRTNVPRTRRSGDRKDLLHVRNQCIREALGITGKRSLFVPENRQVPLKQFSPIRNASDSQFLAVNADIRRDNSDAVSCFGKSQQGMRRDAFDYDVRLETVETACAVEQFSRPEAGVRQEQWQPRENADVDHASLPNSKRWGPRG